MQSTWLVCMDSCVTCSKKKTAFCKLHAAVRVLHWLPYHSCELDMISYHISSIRYCNYCSRWRLIERIHWYSAVVVPESQLFLSLFLIAERISAKLWMRVYSRNVRAYIRMHMSVMLRLRSCGRTPFWHLLHMAYPYAHIHTGTAQHEASCACVVLVLKSPMTVTITAHGVVLYFTNWQTDTQCLIVCLNSEVLRPNIPYTKWRGLLSHPQCVQL